jgi:hypothetical protein
MAKTKNTPEVNTPVVNAETGISNEQLLDILKFTPRTYRISIYGYGGEYVMGHFDRKIFDYFRNRRIDFNEWCWGSVDEELLDTIPDDMRPFEPGQWYDCDGLVHENGADFNAATIEISDENSDTVMQFDAEEIYDLGGSLDGSEVEEYVHTNVTEQDAVFFGISSEKGTFFEGEIELTTPFDVKKLTIVSTDIDGAEIITGVMYDGEDIDCIDMSTTGKGSEMAMFGRNAEDDLIKYSSVDDLEWPMTDWYPKKIKPVRDGQYEVRTAGKQMYTHPARWEGGKWMLTYNDDEVKVKEWRGINVDPDTVTF